MNTLIVAPYCKSHLGRALSFVENRIGNFNKMKIQALLTKGDLINRPGQSEILSFGIPTRKINTQSNSTEVTEEFRAWINVFDKIIFESINLDNEKIIRSIQDRKKIHIILTDDEINRRSLFYEKIRETDSPDKIQHIRRELKYSLGVEEAFEHSYNFYIGGNIWEEYFLQKRKSTYKWINSIMPFEYELALSQIQSDSQMAISVCLAPKSQYPADAYIKRSLSTVKNIITHKKNTLDCEFIIPIDQNWKIQNNSPIKINFLPPTNRSNFYSKVSKCNFILLNQRGGVGLIFQFIRGGRLVLSDATSRNGINYQILKDMKIKIIDIDEWFCQGISAHELTQIASSNKAILDSHIESGFFEFIKLLE